VHQFEGVVDVVAGELAVALDDVAADAVLAAHLKGEVHIGLYPLLDGDKCWWLAADFDGPEAMFDALMYVKAGRALQVPVALEVSRSGVGAHAWVFFTSPVPAEMARRLGTGR
jgi:hypothetical protein